MHGVNEKKLKKIEWMLDETDPLADNEKYQYVPSYGDLTELNHCRLIMDSVGRETLKKIGKYAVELLETSVAIYEANGDYAFGMFSSGWCRFMDSASRNLCKTDDNREALSCGKWLCHENCWNDSVKKTIATEKSTDIECVGGIHLYSEPIFAGQKVIGAINIGYGDPPKNPDQLKALAESFRVDPETLKEIGNRYKSRPEFIVNVAKRHLGAFASLIGEIVSKAEAEKTIQKKESFLKSLVDAVPIPIFYKDLEGRYLGSNKAFEQFLGKKEDEITGKTVFDINPTDLANIYASKDRELLKAGGKQAYETQAQNFAKERRNVIFNKAVFHDAEGEVAGLIGAIQDVTERQKAEKDLRNAYNLLQQLIDNSLALIVVKNRKGVYILANKISENQLGLKQGEMIGKTDYDLFPKKVADRLIEDDKKVFETGDPLHIEENFRILGRDYTFATAKFPLFDANDDLYAICGMATDITERLEMEKTTEGK